MNPSIVEARTLLEMKRQDAKNEGVRVGQLCDWVLRTKRPRPRSTLVFPMCAVLWRMEKKGLVVRLADESKNGKIRLRGWARTEEGVRLTGQGLLPL